MNRKQKKQREKRERATRRQAVLRQLPSAPASERRLTSGTSASARLLVKKLWTGIGLVWKLAAAVGVLLALIGIYALQPQLSVEEKDYSLDPADVTRTPW